MSMHRMSNLHEWSARDIESRTVLDLDLNYPPPDEGIDPPTYHHEAEAHFYDHFQRQAMDITEVVDEDIAIISPRKFAEARKNFRRNHFQSRCGVVIRLNGHAGVYSRPGNDDVPVQEQTVQDLELCLSTESSHWTGSKATDVGIAPALGQSSGPPVAPSLRCAICIEPLVEETTTKCGHIFCRNCIEAAIAAQHRCPICRRKLRKRDIIRIYLPFSS